MFIITGTLGIFDCGYDEVRQIGGLKRNWDDSKQSTVGFGKNADYSDEDLDFLPLDS